MEAHLLFHLRAELASPNRTSRRRSSTQTLHFRLSYCNRFQAGWITRVMASMTRVIQATSAVTCFLPASVTVV